MNIYVFPPFTLKEREVENENLGLFDANGEGLRKITDFCSMFDMVRRYELHDYLAGLDKGAQDVANATSANPCSAVGMEADSFVPEFLPMIVGTGNPKPAINVGMPTPGVIAPSIRVPVLSEGAQNAMQAIKNEVRRTDLNLLQFDENRESSLEAVRIFVSQMPVSEQVALLDTDARPRRSAQDRFTVALFKEAYGNEDLPRLQAQAVVPESRNIFRAMITVAWRMSRLESAGDLDIRSLVTRAAIQAVNARREGVKLEDYARQAGMFGKGDAATDAGIAALVDMFAKNFRSAKEMARILDAAAAFAYSEANKPAVDMFGETQRATRQDVADLISKENADEPQQDFFGEEQQQAGPESGEAEGRAEREGESDLVESAGAETAREDAQREGDRAAADGRGQADIGEAEGAGELKFSRSSGLAAAREKISAFLERIRGRVFNSKGRESFEDYMPVSDSFADRVQELTGIDVHGFTHSIVDDNVRHALSRHGQGNESRPGQIPITEKDLASLPEIVSSPDSIRLAGTSRVGGQPVIVIEKQMPDGTTVAVEEIRKGRGKLMFLTAYKKKTRPILDAARKGSPVQTSETLRARSSEEQGDRMTVNGPAEDPRTTTSKTSQAHIPASETSLSDQREQTRSAEDVRESLRADKDVGRAFSALEESGAAAVVENTEAAMFAIAAGRPAAVKASVSEIPEGDGPARQRAKEIIEREFPEGTTVEVAVEESGMVVEVGRRGFMHSAFGQRASERTLVAALHIRDLLRKAVSDGARRDKNGTVLKESQPGGAYKLYAGIEIDGRRYVAVITVKPREGMRNRGVYYDVKAKEGGSGQSGRVSDPSEAHRQDTSVTPGNILPAPCAIVKESANGEAQAIYDPVSGKAYFIAGNIKAGDEKGVFLHEVGVHMAADQGAAEQMAPLIRRAQQIVQNGSRNGDPLAQRVHQRLEDAGLLDENGRIKKGFEDEAYACLVEEFANSPERASHPVREWFATVVSRIKAWLLCSSGIF